VFSSKNKVPTKDDSSTNASAHRWIGTWSVLVSVATIAAGSFVGQLWMPLGLFTAATVGTAFGSIAEALVGILGTAIGGPVLRSVGSTIFHSPIYLPAIGLGLAFGLWLHHRALRILDKDRSRSIDDELSPRKH
jgi:hypothetical protein